MANTKPRAAASPRTRKPIDRQRRQRILDATLQVITERGMTQLSHRRIARTAGVPLSATTYYFGTLDELIEVALSYAVERDLERFRDAVEAHHLALDPIAGLAALTSELSQDKESGVLALELCIAAIRNERLKPLARRWDDAWREMLEPYLGERDAIVANTLVVGIILRSAMATDRLPVTEITAVLRAGLGR